MTRRHQISAFIALALLWTALGAVPTWAGPTAQEPLVIEVGDPQSDTVDVAIAYSQLTFADGSAERVLIGRDDLFADSLPSGRLQGTDTPLLLTSPDSLADDVADEIARLGAIAATILGGEAAISPAVAAALADLGLDVARVAGASRIQTAVEAALAGGPADTAILARAFPTTEPTQAFADALAAGAWAARADWPVLLTATDTLSPDTLAHVEDEGIERVVVVGGEAAISDDAVAALPDDVTVERIAADTRAGTAVAITEARGFASAAEAAAVILVDGSAETGWAGGFAAAATSAALDAPVVLALGDILPPETIAWLQGEAQGGAWAGADPPTRRRLICATLSAPCTAARDILAGVPLPPSLVPLTVDTDGPAHQNTVIDIPV